MGESACAHTTLPIFLSSNQSTPQTIYNMAASNVGNSSLYEAGDQRNPPDSEKAKNQATPYEEGKSNSHDQNDPKDERSIGNRLAAAEPQNDDQSRKNLSKEDKAAQKDATLPAHAWQRAVKGRQDRQRAR